MNRRDLLKVLATIPVFKLPNERMSPMTWPAFFFAPHPDDGTLSMATAIRAHLTAGRDVHVVAVTQGEASVARTTLNGTGVSSWWGIQHNPTAEGYDPLTIDDFAAARIREQHAALVALGVSGQNIHVHTLPNGGISATDVRNLITSNYLVPGASYKGTHFDDPHPDHAAVGQALHDMLHDGTLTDVRYYAGQWLWSQFSSGDYSYAMESPVALSDDRLRIINAVRAFSSWMPPYAYAIGRHSTTEYFDNLLADMRCMRIYD